MSRTNAYKEHLLYDENERSTKNIDIGSDSCQLFHPYKHFMDHVIHANILWTHAICLINAKLLWTYSTHETLHQCNPRHPRYLADSNTERNRVFKSQLSYCKKHSLIGTQHRQWTTAQNLINEGFWRNREHFLPDPFEILSNWTISVLEV